eukprot:scpid22021/ scgid13784/ Bifunctional heparan sulfate N-deacetylase/N-sulfotransferase; Glucosaminyl N-deacetylase/N-sulfotransferase; Sulfateless; Heparan sulfate N-deacetylase; Heparan sulfate N-sulfotransferase
MSILARTFDTTIRVLLCRKQTVKRILTVAALAAAWIFFSHVLLDKHGTAGRRADGRNPGSKNNLRSSQGALTSVSAESVHTTEDWFGQDVDSRGGVQVGRRVQDGNADWPGGGGPRGMPSDDQKPLIQVIHKPGLLPVKSPKHIQRDVAFQPDPHNERGKSPVHTVRLPSRRLPGTLPRATKKTAERDRFGSDIVRGMTVGVGVEPIALLVLCKEPFFSLSLADMRELLGKHRIRFEIGRGSASPDSFFPQAPSMGAEPQGRYSVIIFENWSLYTDAPDAKREDLDSYCRLYGVGMVAFVSPAYPFVFKQVTVRPLVDTTRNVSMVLRVNGRSPMLRIVRDGGEMLTSVSGGDWCAFEGNTSAFDPVEYARLPDGADSTEWRISLLDTGRVDGIRRVLFCQHPGMYLWLHKALFLDAVSHLSPATLGLPLARRFLVDIDDIFVAPLGTKMSPDDVEQLVKTQEEVRKQVPRFTFNLGFVGSKFAQGTPWEAKGDHHFVELAQHFYWFPHTYTHIAPHRTWNVSEMIRHMKANKEFAETNKIPVSGAYAISPKHSGVYPVHEPLYTAWREVWGVKTTSTEEYMHLKPGYKRRGFIYRGIKVVPRQVCGLYTHTFKRQDYPGGIQRLQETAEGGDMFESILHNTICIFMTHVSNYGHDRLGNYVVKAVVDYIQRWTNLELSYSPPHEAVSEYFEQHLDEAMPFWLDPCRDPRHYAIWSEEKRRCFNLPNVLVVGPQKTGTTALLDFMTLHPKISRNRNTPKHFEEMQFFSNDANYLLGLDWYMQHMPLVNTATNLTITYNASDTIEKPAHFIVEKSATYFDSYMSPLRAWRLMPSVKVIVILVDPVKRAYSWWQHQVAHKDPITTQVSFRTLLLRNHRHNRAKSVLKQRCLFPGQYAVHLKRWLAFFGPKQIHIIDGEELVKDPVPVMHAVQKFIGVQFIDYAQHIKKSATKGFFCPVINGKLKCLGKGKGRTYAPMEPSARTLLKAYYAEHNKDLAKILGSMKVPLPTWLKEDLRKREATAAAAGNAAEV